VLLAWAKTEAAQANNPTASQTNIFFMVYLHLFKILMILPLFKKIVKAGIHSARDFYRDEGCGDAISLTNALLV
jgi:hypothetical protein